MYRDPGSDRPRKELPAWVPDPVRMYLAHVQDGDSLRDLARRKGCHASTVMRQVRRTEGLRDDPLADAALISLERIWRDLGPDEFRQGEPRMAKDQITQDLETFQRDSRRTLKALSEPGAILVVADGVEDGVVVVTGEDDRPVRRAVVRRSVAEMLALKEWIEGRTRGRLARYSITGAGRAELGRLVALAESARVVTDEDRTAPAAKGRSMRTAGAETPLRILARRRRADGSPFLTREMLRAAERFRESFEIAHIGGALGDDLDRLLNGEDAGPIGEGATTRPVSVRARDSLARALRRLGPDMGEVVIQTCCREAGMEQIETDLDFPARSGKVILRIALSMLARHYASVGDEGLDMVY